MSFATPTSLPASRGRVWAGVAVVAAIALCANAYALLLTERAFESYSAGADRELRHALQITRLCIIAAAGISCSAMFLAAGAWRSATPGELKEEEQTPQSPVAPNELSGRLLAIQEEERKNLSRELHDGIGQTITALKMELARVTPADGADRERLDRARRLAEEVLRTIRNISLLLRPTALDDLGLDAALRWHVDDFSRRTSIYCELDCSIPNEKLLPEALKTCVYRVVQEALNNCEKHAAPTRVSITIKYDTENLNVRIRDDGAGFHVGSAALSLGILGMRERAAMLGGSVQIESTTGAGTTVALSLPLGGLDGRDKPANEYRRIL